MVRTWIKLAVASAALTLSAAGVCAPANVAAAVAATSERMPDNVGRDEGRKPAQLLAFLGLEQGMNVLDPFGGNRYWTEIIAPAVGPTGSVTVWQPTQFMSDKTRASFATYLATHRNVAFTSSPFESPNFAPNSYDFALINLDYHDVYWQSDKNKIVRMEPQAWLKILYAAMKPGAIVGVVDHAAKAGSEPRASVEAMHRIDPAVVRADFKRAGFVLVGESQLLRNRADDHRLGVFDQAIRGKTDRFVLKYKKPAR